MHALLNRVARCLLPALIVVEIVLVRGGWLAGRSAIWVALATEAALALLGLRQVLLALRGYRQGRRAGADAWTALEDGLAVLLPRQAARIVALEPRLWVCLVRWIGRHRPRPDEFGYARGSALGIMLVVVCFSAPIEILLGELLVPWAWLRWVLLAACLYGLVWAFGLYASLVVLPHRLEADGLRVRFGALAEAYIGYGDIASIERDKRGAPKGREGLQLSRDGRAAHFAIGGQTEVLLRLRAPVRPHGLLGPIAPVTIVRLAADDPGAFERALRARQPAPATAAPEATHA